MSKNIDFLKKKEKLTIKNWLTDARAESDFTMDDVPYVGVVAKIMWIDLENPREE